MNRIVTGFRRHKEELAVGLLRFLTYAGLTVLFFGLLSIENWPLRHLNRTLATTALTWFAMTVAMRAVYGGYDVGRRKSKPIISSMILAVICTDLLTYLQLQIMNVNVNRFESLRLFGPDFFWLLLCMVLQLVWIILMVRWGNQFYFRLYPPRECLLVMGSTGDREAVLRKIGRYALQWHVGDIAGCDDPDLDRRIDEADVVFLAEIPDEKRMLLLKRCYDLHRDVLCKAQLQDIMLASAESIVVDDAPFLEMDYRKMTLSQRIVKRLMDIIISLLVLVLFSPLMLLIALCIRMEDHGPAIFRQKRITVGGHEFTICKFRTMRPETAGEERSAQKDDDRITRVGAVLRRTRLDELPQFWNILTGDMTLVGPRPEMLANVEKYKTALPTFVYREKMKAGLTGYAQIEGRYNTSAEDKLMLDLMYIENFSIWTDIRLLFRTLTVFFKRDSTEGFAPQEPGKDEPA